MPGWNIEQLRPGESFIDRHKAEWADLDRARADAVAIANLIDRLPESEQGFFKESRQVAQKRSDAKKARTAQQDRDRAAVQDLANAMFGATDGDTSAIRSLDRAAIAADADVVLARKRGERLWIEAGGLLRDYVREVAKATAEGRSTADVDFTLDYERDVRIAAAEVGSAEIADRRRQLKDDWKEKLADHRQEVAAAIAEGRSTAEIDSGLDYDRDVRIPAEAIGNDTVTKRQRQLLRDHLDRDAYMDRVRDEPGVARTVIRTDAAGNATASVPIRFTQSANDRFDKNGRGFVADVAGYYGGSSRQIEGGTCFQRPFVEKGKRSTKSAMTMRVVAMVPKVKSRRRGITDPAVIKRIVDMSETGMAPEAIAADVGEKVSRVKGTIHASQNDGRAWSGNNNDTRTVHRRKRVTLDDTHCSLRTDCRELIRVDKDEIWETWDAFMTWLHERSWTIDGRQVLPQKVCYVRDDNFPERVTKPHIIFILPEKKGVWYNGGTPLAMFNGVAAALTVMYGGDPGGLANIADIKMPTSPRVVAIDIETEHLPDLSELCKVLHVDLRQTRDRTMREMSVAELIEAGIDEDKSGALYSLFWKRAWEIALLWESTRQLIVGRDLDRRKLCDDLHEALLTDPILLPELDLLDHDEREAAEAGLATAAKNVSWKFGRGRHAGSRGYDVGAAESLVTKRLAAAAAETPDMPIDVVKIAKSAGAAYGTAQRNARSVRRIADAMRTIAADGTVPTVALVSALTNIGERTVPKHWDAAVALLAARQIVSHVLTVPEPVSAGAANGSCVWGVTAYDSLSEHPVAIPEPAQAVPGETLTLASILSAPVQRLVDRLAPPIQPSARQPTGRNLLEFVRPGATLYRSTLGLREQARRQRKGMRVVDGPAVGRQRA
jgi:hypothetical protein